MDFDLGTRTILLVLHGSHAYGMARPESDVDLRGIAIPPPAFFHGYLNRFEQSETPLPREFSVGRTTMGRKLETMVGRKIPPEEKLDSVIYDIRKLFALATKANPNIWDILWADEQCIVIETPLARNLLEHRDLFLSTKARWSYAGYAVSQLKRIKLHRKYLLNPPSCKPSRGDFGLPEHSVMPRDQLMAAESLIARKIEEWIGSKEELPKEVLLELRNRTAAAIRDIWAALASEFLGRQGNSTFLDTIAPPITENGDLDEHHICRAAGKHLGYDSNFLELLDRERGYRSAIRQWRQYQDWKENRNPVRAEMEAKFGLDLKHASQLVRLLRMAKEIMETGKVVVRRPDADELLAIRNGAWTYEQLVEWAEHQDALLETLYDAGGSPLPKKPKHAELDRLCQSLVEQALEEMDSLLMRRKK